MGRMGTGGHRRDRMSADRLVEETQAFLDGRFLEVTVASGGGSPAWAQLNWISHTGPDELGEAARRPPSPPARLGSWAWAVEALTAETVTLACGDPQVVGELQRACLIPLELSMMLPPWWNVLPAEVLALAVQRLRAHPSARRGPTKVAPPEE